jgi:hypothetical protein
MTEKKQFITIKDYSTSSAIWGGEEIYMFATSPLTLSSQQVIEAKIKNYQDIDPSIDGDDYQVNFDRRKSYVNYGGFNNQQISLTCIYNPLTIGTTFSYNDSTKKVFTPSKLFELILNPRTVYINDEFLIRNLLSSAEGTSPAIYTSKGIPVVLKNWSLKPTVEGKEVIMDLTFTEDKEV